MMKRHLAIFAAGLGFLSVPASPADLPPAAPASTFDRCPPRARYTCVVDGDTIWLNGDKVRIADINTPETSHPECEREAQLGKAATDRLIVLLNEGPFVLHPAPGNRDRDRYGRLLRTVTRGGQSIGLTLVREGLAEKWKGRRSSWC